MKILSLFFTVFNSVFLIAQNSDLRKLVMNSDVIVYVEFNDFQRNSKNINDHFSESYLKIKSYQKVIKNDSGIRFLDKEIFEPEDGNDFYNNSELNEGGCTAIGEVLEHGKKYYSLIFLKKGKKQLYVLAHIWRKDLDYENIIFKINEIQKLDKIKELKERYEKTLDYYLAYDKISTWENTFRDFIDFYKKHKILPTDDLVFTEKQLLLVKEKFLAGNEIYYYDFIKDKFPQEITLYYLKKMETIQKIGNEEETDFYDFQEAYERATKTDFMDSSELGKLKDKLTGGIPFEEKRKIMQMLIDHVKAL